MDGWRDRVFVMTKVCARDYAGAKRHVEDSLRRLPTDRVDFLQLYAVQYADDVERIKDPSGGRSGHSSRRRGPGKARFLGFSRHRAFGAWDVSRSPVS